MNFALSLGFRVFLVGFVQWAGGLPGRAAFDAFLRLDEIQGEAVVDSHRNWIEIKSVEWGLSNAGFAARQQFSTISMTKPVDKATPLLFEHCASGKQIPNAAIELVQRSGAKLRFFRIELKDVRVASVQNSGTAGLTDQPFEQVQVAFGRIAWTYKEFDISGKPLRDIGAYWDLVKNEGGYSSESLLLLRVDAIRTEAGGLRMEWEAQPGQTYRILGSEAVTGPYIAVQTVVVDESGAVSHSIPIERASRFFVVEAVAE
jgi:type VI secretion system secreted protein Hcp